MASVVPTKFCADPVPGDIKEKHLFITDLRLDDRGIIPDDNDGDLLNGREGNHVLVNGIMTIRPGRDVLMSCSSS